MKVTEFSCFCILRSQFLLQYKLTQSKVDIDHITNLKLIDFFDISFSISNRLIIDDFGLLEQKILSGSKLDETTNFYAKQSSF